MLNLFRFINRYHFFFLFLLLQVVALLLTLNSKHFHQAYLFHSSNTLAGRVYQTYNNVNSYMHLREVNEQLLEENMRLKEKQRENFLVTDQQIFEYQDSIFKRRYTYLNAGVINKSVNRRNNYMTLDKGRQHGIEPDMGVITGNGVAGIVIHVSENFSSVMSLLHSDMLVSVKIGKNDHIGTLQWEGGDYRRAVMSYIPPHVDLSVGDSIFTSGHSRVFPENVFVGTIEDWEVRRGENFFTALVKLAIDHNKLSLVYVVKNLMREEQEGLESAAPGEIQF